VKHFTVVVLVLLLTACAAIPPQAPELSTELGNRLAQLESAHLNLVQRYFEEKRQRVEAFIHHEWLPVFAQEFYQNPTISKTWDTIVRENSSEDRVLFLLKTGPGIMAKLDEKRQEMITPLNELERRVTHRLQTEYLQARAINASLTSYLTSAAKVADNRDRYLNMVGIESEMTDQFVNETNAVLSLLSDGTKSNSEKVKQYLADIEKILNKF